MISSFMASTLIAASVVLVPKTGPIEKKQMAIPAESRGVSTSSKSKSKKDEGEIVLRKATKKKGKQASKNQKQSGPRTDYDHENLDKIYKKEREYFKSGKNREDKKRRAATVSGPLAAIPSEVVNSMIVNLRAEQLARAPKPPSEKPSKKVEKADEGILTGEGGIRETSTTQLPRKLPPKKIVYRERKVQVKEFNPIELKEEVYREVLLAEGKDPKNARMPSTVEQPAKETPEDILEKIEAKYISQFVTINVKSEVTQALLERTKNYSGQLFIAPKSRFKMQITEPNKHMLLMNGKNIWVVDYPLDETQDKVQILHSKSAKNLKNQAFLDIFMGVGNLQKKFKIESSDKKNDEITYKLVPKKKDEQVERVELKLNSRDELIKSIAFWDSLGNKTQLEFKKQEFKPEVDNEVFKFQPPKDASITYL